MPTASIAGTSSSAPVFRKQARGAIRKTKIIATIGPASDGPDLLARLILAGTDIVRLNMAHADHAWTRTAIRRIREASCAVGRDIAVMMDVKGPEIRTGALSSPLELQAGETIDLVCGAAPAVPTVRAVAVNYPGLGADVAQGGSILVDNGLIRLTVLETGVDRVRCRVDVGGSLGSRRHINLPGVNVSLPPFTDKDAADVAVGVDAGVDFIAQSFVRQAEDVRILRRFLGGRGSSARIIAKIEDQSAIRNLDEIIEVADGIMVARGDLGIECPFEELPVIQRRVVNSCIAVGRPVIIATHMLESMISNPVPTRAEITDVANAVYEQADAVMLSGETATGKYPVECVGMLDTIARRIEREGDQRASAAVFTSERMKVLNSAAVLANEVPNSKIVTFTRRGITAQGLAALRPVFCPIFVFTPSPEVFRQLRLVRSVEPFLMSLASHPDATIENAVTRLIGAGLVASGDKLIVASDILSQDRIVESIQLRTVE